MMMNALRKQAVDEGLFVSGFDYKNTSSGVQDEWNYNVYASNYQEPGSASYERWKNIAGSKAYKNEQAKKVDAQYQTRNDLERQIEEAEDKGYTALANAYKGQLGILTKQIEKTRPNTLNKKKS